LRYCCFPPRWFSGVAFSQLLHEGGLRDGETEGQREDARFESFYPFSLGEGYRKKLHPHAADITELKCKLIFNKKR
jgi:hypothetical protein